MTGYSAERLLERAAQMERQAETWKGNPEYADTLRMDAAALRFMAASAAARDLSTTLAISTAALTALGALLRRLHFDIEQAAELLDGVQPTS